MSDTAFLHAMVRVESAWLTILVDSGVAPEAARTDLTPVVCAADAADIARGAEGDGNPVTGLVAMLRERTGGLPARWLHRGLTSQDVIDTALMLCARDVLVRVNDEITSQVLTLAPLIEAHRDAPMVARTLTQHAVPMTIGVKLSVWLSGVLDASELLPEVLASLPVQAGGAAGTLAATTELTTSAAVAIEMSQALAASLRLAPGAPWHTRRNPITRIGDALATCCDAWAHIAADIATLGRPEIGELAEPRGGGSSTMPNKQNPVLSLLIRRAALTAGPLAAILHSASADSVDERSNGGWHAEWATLRTLARRTAVTAAQTSELLAGLRIDSERAKANLVAAEGVRAEQQSMAELVGRQPLPTYTGAADLLVDAALRRARKRLKGNA